MTGVFAFPVEVKEQVEVDITGQGEQRGSDGQPCLAFLLYGSRRAALLSSRPSSGSWE